MLILQQFHLHTDFLFQVIMFPLYEHFVISTFTCLRRWMTAPEADPDDTSYWDEPPPAPTFMPAEPIKKKKGKKPRFRTTTVPPSADFTVCEICVITSSDYYMALCVSKDGI